MNPLAETVDRLRDLGLRRATLLVDERRTRANIDRFAARARTAGVTLRPHFKTHQSAAVGQWFRDAGVTRATVSSVGQAAYFADHGWQDLTLAVPANPAEVALYDDLAARIDLGLLVDATTTVGALANGLHHPVRVWLDVDVGYGRTGVPWQEHERLVTLARAVTDAATLHLAGLLTHAGQAYGAADRDDAARIFADARERLAGCGDALVAAGFEPPALSAGDTPGFSATRDWSGLDEARPGNFVFHDLMQLELGVCTAADLACAVAAPVVGIYPERDQVVVHAGAVHLSKERLPGTRDHCYGRLLTVTADGFGDLVPAWSLLNLSQEHGVLQAGDDDARRALRALRPGDPVLVVPVHSCLACEQFAAYRTLTGDRLTRYRRQ